MDLEDEDPLMISDWGDFGERCLAAGKKDLLLKYIQENIKILHYPLKAGIRAYCLKSMGELNEQKILEGLRQAKLKRQIKEEEKANEIRNLKLQERNLSQSFRNLRLKNR